MKRGKTAFIQHVFNLSVAFTNERCELEGFDNLSAEGFEIALILPVTIIV